MTYVSSCDLLPCRVDLIDDAVEVVDLAQAFEQGAAIDGDGAILRRVVAIVATDGVDVAVEYQPDDFPFFVDERAARIAADDVVGSAKVHRRLQVQLGPGGK